MILCSREVYELTVGHACLAFNVRKHSIKDIEASLLRALGLFLAVYINPLPDGSTALHDMAEVAKRLKETKAYRGVHTLGSNEVQDLLKVICAQDSAIVARFDVTFTYMLRVCFRFLSITDPLADGTSDLLRRLLVKEGVPDDSMLEKLKDSQKLLYLISLRVLYNSNGIN